MISATPGSFATSTAAGAPSSCPASSTTTPANPSASPATRGQVGRSPSTGQASIAAQIGMV